MDGGESRRMIKYTGGAQDNTIINQIMFRFRPIAPKPAAGSPDSDVKNLLVSKRRAKRKYVRVRRNNILKKNQNISSSSDQQNGKETEDASFRKATTMVTLQLLPEKSDKTKESPKRETRWCNQELSRHHHDQDHEENFKLKQPLMVDGEDQAAAVSKNKIESWVTVECVTETYGCMDIGSGSRGWRCTDVERVKNLEEDRRPGFISDGSDKVRWVNGAYKKMIKEENDEEGQSAESVERMVYLLTKQKLMPYIYCSALTCWVRLQCRLGANQKYNSKMVPCDVWRMDCGGFAWRLDVEAALSLSLGH